MASSSTEKAAHFLPALLAFLPVSVTIFSILVVDPFSLLTWAGVAGAVTVLLLAPFFIFQAAMMRSNRVWKWIGLAWLLTASVLSLSWATHLGPLFYRARFQAMAASVASGDSFDTPRRIGPYVIQRGEVERGLVCLWTGTHPEGRSGYIHASSAQKLPFNSWSVISAGPGWQFLVED